MIFSPHRIEQLYIESVFYLNWEDKSQIWERAQRSKIMVEDGFSYLKFWLICDPTNIILLSHFVQYPMFSHKVVVTEHFSYSGHFQQRAPYLVVAVAQLLLRIAAAVVGLTAELQWLVGSPASAGTFAGKRRCKKINKVKVQTEKPFLSIYPYKTQQHLKMLLRPRKFQTPG